MTFALITTYHPSAQVLHNVRSIASQVDAVYICDNSPMSHADFFAAIAPAEKIRYIFAGENLGISRAYNRVLTDPAIPWNEDDFIFFFDQDSLIPPAHITQMLAVYHQVQDAGFPVGCLGPAYFNTSSNSTEMPRVKRRLIEKTYAVSSIITSSMLCRYGELKAVGFWNEDVFLDMADWDLCWRLCAAGKLCCMTEAVVFRHSVGLGEKKIGPFRLRVGNPYREYYQVRECLYLLTKRYTPLKYRIRFLATLLIRSPLHILFLDHRRARLNFIIRGLADFFRGKKGSLGS